MTAIEWDQVGERRFETGVDRGVLYLPDGVAVPWNGLAAVTEMRSRDVKSYYMDGVKYLDYVVPGNFAGKISAFTYPDELDTVMGNRQFAPGVILHDQQTKTFNLSYRTRVGNDLEGVDHGYKLHIMYNLVANPSDVTYTAVGASPTPQVFEWGITSTPEQMFGVRPTGHISLESRRIDPALLETLEETLYGTDESAPSLPSLVDLIGWMAP